MARTQDDPDAFFGKAGRSSEDLPLNGTLKVTP
jgi:hypothetical protein